MQTTLYLNVKNKHTLFKAKLIQFEIKKSLNKVILIMK